MMDWGDFFIGIVFLAAALLFYKIRKWGNYSGELAFVNKAKVFRDWLTITMCIMVGIVFIFKSLPF